MRLKAVCVDLSDFSFAEDDVKGDAGGVRAVREPLRIGRSLHPLND